MPTPKTTFASTRAIPPQFVNAEAGQKIEEMLHLRIAERAYAAFEESGRQDGNDQQNWARAKAETLQSMEMRESGTWMTLSAAIPGAMSQSIQIFVTVNHVIVLAETAANTTFLEADLNVEVDPTTATASFKDQSLNLIVKKRRSGNAIAGA